MAEPSFRNDRPRAPDDAETRRVRERENGLQPDPTLAEGRARSGMGWLIAICVVILLAAVFYALDSSGSRIAGIVPPTQTKPATTSAAPPPNSGPGTTTGTATNRPPQSENAGSESDRAAKPVDKSGNPPATRNGK